MEQVETCRAFTKILYFAMNSSAKSMACFMLKHVQDFRKLCIQWFMEEMYDPQ